MAVAIPKEIASVQNCEINVNMYLDLAFNPLQNHTYSNILKILQPKKGKFSDKNSDIFHIPAQNIDCG